MTAVAAKEEVMEAEETVVEKAEEVKVVDLGEEVRVAAKVAAATEAG